MKKLSIVFGIIVLFLFITPLVGADFGPKAKINIHFIGDTSNLYVTLLAKEKSKGPWTDVKENPEYIDRDSLEISSEIVDKFIAYEDEYFLWTLSYQIDGNNDYCWQYYPPNNFKLLIYDAITDRFRISESYTRYAFSSYYTVNLTNDVIVLNNSYDYVSEVLGLIGRVVVTLIVEIAIAVIFRYHGKKAYLTILTANIITQIMLNIILNVQIYFGGFFVFTTGILYFLAEFLVFLIESLVYSLIIKNKKVSINISYAFVANLVSFVVGFLLLLLI